MQIFPPTLVIRHKKENLKKCSLRGLEQRPDFRFLTYPGTELPDLSNYLLLAIDGTELSQEDRGKGLLILDSTWRYTDKMLRFVLDQYPIPKRTLPAHFRTAYPRRQEDCTDPSRGLASIEAIYIAYHILGRDVSGLLDDYYWGEEFLRINVLL
jgi:pre-rRNA-processing protein TSR3